MIDTTHPKSIESVELNGYSLTIDKVIAVARYKAKVRIHPSAIENIKRFLLYEAIPADIRMGLARNLATSKDANWQKLLEDPDLMDLLLV